MEPLAELAKIFMDNTAPLRRRIEAAALVLQHAAPEGLTNQATDFLMSVAKMDVAPDYRIEAVKSLAKRQTPKASAPPTNGGNPALWREQWIRRISDERRKELYKLGLWPPPKGWMDDLIDPNWVPPEGPGYGPVEPEGFWQSDGRDARAQAQEWQRPETERLILNCSYLDYWRYRTLQRQH